MYYDIHISHVYTTESIDFFRKIKWKEKLLEDETRKNKIEIYSRTHTDIHKIITFSTYLTNKFNYFRKFKILRMILIVKNWKNSTHGTN